MKIDGKTIWITGASSGIGEALTYNLEKRNCKLILSSRKEDQLNQVKLNCKNQENIKLLPLDLCDYDGMQDKASKAIAAFGPIDILINNAGLSQRSLISNTNFEVYKKLIDVNYLGTVAISKALLPYFIENKKGKFVIISSLMGKFSSPYRSGYCGAKHALHGFFDALRMEHEKDGIGVTMICPGFINTNVAQNALTEDGSAQNQQDDATENGFDVTVFGKKMIRAIERNKFEAYIGGKEAMATYLRIFPKLLHRIVLRSTVK
ncbi:SDR family oxidoreductase [Cellulophaga sp. L1A9]|uniref:SDR family oxidoreductase n=1 Tax=Cellulophaga sp. L1A9 TaxID=2686362 RepID=UPI00131E47DF|nr:SDR family oxidoreductase [Cellulophaga sp. L1A9]